MTVVEALTPPPGYVVSGTGPYPVTHGFLATDELVVFVVDGDGVVTPLAADEFTLSAASSYVSADLMLTTTAAAAYAGQTLYIRRQTAIQQGWAAAETAREKGIAQQLARLTMTVQDHDRLIGSAMRSIPEFGPLAPVTAQPAARAGRVVGWSDDGLGLRTGMSLDTLEDMVTLGGTSAQPYRTYAAALAAAASLPSGTIVYVVADETMSGFSSWYYVEAGSLTLIKAEGGGGSFRTQIIAGDGRLGSYPLTAVPADLSWLEVTVDGIVQYRGEHYQIDVNPVSASGYGIQFLPAPNGQLPGPENRIFVRYPTHMEVQDIPPIDDWSAATLARRKMLDALQFAGVLDQIDVMWVIGRDEAKSRAAVIGRLDLTPVGDDWRIFPGQALCANHGRNTEYFAADENGNDVNGAVALGRSYFRTGFIPAKAEKMRADDAHASIFIVEPGLFADGLTYRGTPRSNLSPAIGSKNPNGDSTTAGSLIKLRPLDVNHTVLFRLNTDTDITVPGAKTHVGMHTVTRSGSTCAAYHNDTLLGTNAGFGDVLSEYEVLLGGHFDSGPDEHGDYPFAMVSFGRSLTAEQVAVLHAAVKEYLIEVGVINAPVLIEPIRQVQREWTYAAKARIDLTKGEALTSYTRTGASAVINKSGYWEAVAADTWAVDHDPLTREPKGLRTYNGFEQLETQSGALSNARFQAVGSTKATVTTAVGAYGDVGSPVSYVQTTANSEHGVEADYANADIDDYVQFDVHLRPYGASDPVLSDIGVLLEVVGKDGAVQGWVWYHWNHDRIEQSGGGAYNVELNRFYDGMRRVSLSVPAGSGAGDVTCRVLSVDPAADWQVTGKPSVSFVGDTDAGFVVCGWQVTTETDDWSAYCKPYLLTTGSTAAATAHTAQLDTPLPLSGQRLVVAARFEQQVGGEAGAQVWRAYDASNNVLGRVTQFNTDGSLGIIANYSGASVQTLVTGTEAEAYQDLRIVYGRDAVADRHLRMTNCREYTPTTPSDTIAAANPVAYVSLGATAAGSFVFPGWLKEFHFFDQTPHPYDMLEFTNRPNRGTMQPALVAPVSALASPWVPRPGLVPVQAGKDAPWISIAKQEIGVCSWVTGDNPEVTKYYQSAFNTSEFFAGLDSTSYCAAGMNWCLQQAGLQGVKDLWAYAFNYYGAALTEYVPGAILTIAKSATEKNIRHVTFCIADVGSGVLTLGFNQGGNLRNNYAVFPKSEVYAIRWPTMPT